LFTILKHSLWLVLGLLAGWWLAETFSPTLARARIIREGVARLTQEDCRALVTKAVQTVQEKAYGAVDATKGEAHGAVEAAKAKVHNAAEAAKAEAHDAIEAARKTTNRAKDSIRSRFGSKEREDPSSQLHEELSSGGEKE
jgi:uncharacterized protein YjbJ (UPF0337 family)